MKREIIEIENLKCGGCANSIKNSLAKLDSTITVDVNLDDSIVSISHESDISRGAFLEVLGKMGYPETGTGTTMQKVKSYVSCAIGRMSS